MDVCKLVRIPFDAYLKLLKLLNEEFWNVQRELKGAPYKVGIRSLIYTMEGIGIDVAFVVRTVSQFISKAGPPHWMAVKRIMRYLKGTLNFNWTLGDKDIALRGFCNLNWAGYTNDQRSTTGICFLLALESFCRNIRKNQPLHCLKWRWSIWPLAITRRKRFDLSNFWHIWDTWKKDRHPSCATHKDV